MVDFRGLLDSVNVMFEAINWAITYLYEKSSSDMLSISEEKSCCSSAELLACCKLACAMFKRRSYLNSLYYNAIFFKLAHVFSDFGFLSQYLQPYV